MRKLLAQTFVIQGLGVALMFLVTVIIARWGGAESQGSFAMVKSMTDLQVAICSLGLPPAIVFMLNRQQGGHNAVYRVTMRYGLALMLVLPLVSLYILRATASSMHDGLILVQALAIGLASAWLTQFALLRGLLLTYTDGPVFSGLSVMQWGVIAVVTVALLDRTPFVFEIGYAASGALSMMVIVAYLRKFHSAVEHAVVESIDWRTLRSQSTHHLLQAGLFGVQPFLTNSILARWGSGFQDVGLFNIASMVVTVPNMLVALVAPVLFNRWSKSLDWQGMRKLTRNALLLGVAAQFAALLASPVVCWVIELAFGVPFVPATSATQILLLAVFAIVVGRILTPALQGIGLTHVATWSCWARLLAGTTVTAAALFGAAAPPLIVMAIAWCVGEYAALGVILMRVKRGLSAGL